MRFCLILSILFAFGSASAQPKAPPPPKKPPPSTGKELAKHDKMPSLDDAARTMEAALAEASKPAPNCAAVANSKVRVAWFRLPVPPPKLLLARTDAFVSFARCAERQKFFALERDIGVQLLKVKAGHAELLARALLGLGEVKVAAQVLSKALRENPKDPNVLVTAAKVECMVGAWKPCLGHAKNAIELSKLLEPTEQRGAVSRALKYASRAALHLGARDTAKTLAAQSEKLGGDPADLAEIRALIAQAETSEVLVEPENDPELPIGIYHLYGKVPEAGPLVRLAVTNLSAKDTQFKAEVSIDGVTQKAIQTLAIGKTETKRVAFNPPLAIGFDLTAIRAARAAQIVVKVTALGGGDRVVYEQTLPVNLQPRDFLPTVAYDGADSEHRTPWFYGAWITPNAKGIDTFLQKAKARAPRNTFSGEQSDTLPQVKAIYEELQAQGMSYVMDPEWLANEGFGQRTRLPTEVLQTTNAQCLEGTLLYATLLEAIGLKPLLVRVPGHAFVGWRASNKDRQKPASGVYFLETTATHDAKFEEAVVYAENEFAEHSKKKAATVIDLSKIRKLGVTPQPFD